MQVEIFYGLTRRQQLRYLAFELIRQAESVPPLKGMT